VAADSNYYYVTDIGKNLEPVAKDGDGKVWKISKNGDSIDSTFITGLNAPKGTGVVNGILYFTDVDKVLGYDLASSEKVFEIDLSSTGALFLNDISVKDNSTLFVSATDINKLYEVNIKEPGFTEIHVEGDLTGPNGLCFDRTNNRLYFNGFGTNNQPNGIVGYVDLNSGNKVVKISERKGFMDGLALLDENTVLYTDWVSFEKEGLLIKLDITTASETVVNEEKIAGPADFLLEGNSVIMPEMVFGNIIKFNLK
jgi:hypothetical protein